MVITTSKSASHASEPWSGKHFWPHLQKCFNRSDNTYGSLRIWRDVLACKDLRNAGITSGRNRVAGYPPEGEGVMRQAGLKATVAPKFVVTTDSKHELPIAENLLNRDFGVTEANVKWASDITYIWTREGWLYLVGHLARGQK